MQRSKIVVLTLVAAFALSAVASASAWASEFKAAKYPVEVKAESTNFQGFKASIATSVCEKGNFTGESGGPSQELTVRPTYEKCKVGLSGVNHEAEVVTTGCSFRFHDEAKSVDVVCETGKEIHVKLKEISPACEINVGPQTGLKTITYTNLAGTVEVEANVTGITFTSNCAGVIGGSNGEYKEGKFNSTTKVAELGTGPARALAKGLFGGLEADAIEA
jgi:hypothetical protein